MRSNPICAALALTVLAGCNQIERQVADDMVAQYEIAKRGGSAIEICSHAGLVAAAFLQAKDEAQYLKWKDTERSDCAKAGMPQ